MNSELAYLIGRKYCFNNFKGKKLQALFKRYPEYHNDIQTSDKDAVEMSLGEFSRDFIRGVYEASYNSRDFSVVTVVCKTVEFAEALQSITKTNGNHQDQGTDRPDTRWTLTFVKHNALDFLHYVYKDCQKSEYSMFSFRKYTGLTNALLGRRQNVTDFKYKKLYPEAVPPFKCRASDSGYDLTIVKLTKRVGNTFWYSTGISVEPPNGFYFDLVARSSLAKTGFMLANGVGIIDRSYTGDITVVLNQIDHTMPELELPFRAAQIIPRHIVHMNPVCSDELTGSERANKGFGEGTFKQNFDELIFHDV